MARTRALGSIPGLAGQAGTHVEGEVIAPGDLLPEGTETFDVDYWYWPTDADIEAGAEPGVKNHIHLRDVPLTASNADIRAAIMELRAKNREEETFGSGGQDEVFVG